MDLLSLLVEGGPFAVVGGGLGWIVTTWLAAKKQGADVEQAEKSLTFELLEQARKEVGLLREELARSKGDSQRGIHIDEAFRIIEDLLNADDSNRAYCERSARAYLKRMKQIHPTPTPAEDPK